MQLAVLEPLALWRVQDWRPSPQAVSVKILECLRDESKLVRAEAIQLVGRYMHLDPALAAQYFDTLLTCLDDAGSGVARHRTALRSRVC